VRNDGLTDEEEQHILLEPKRVRAELRNMLSTQSATQKVPRRVRLLKSALGLGLKMDVFHKLGGRADPKFVEWVDRALALPLLATTPRPTSSPRAVLQRARAVMDAEITGHTNAKHEVLRLLSNWVNGDREAGFAIGLEGEAGVGKTSFAKGALAKSIGRPFCFISLGGASDSSSLLGHNYTYEGAMPGRLVECLTTTKVMDPVIYFDELDKLSGTSKGDEVVHTLIHLTDPVQNTHIVDRYFHGIPLDFSRAILVFSYNDARRVHPVLLDRLRRIKMDSPTVQEKTIISKTHLLPRTLSLSKGCPVTLKDDVIDFVVARNHGEPGMRGIDKDLQVLISSFRLVKTYGDPEILGLAEIGEHLDLPFAQAVLGPAPCSTQYLGMYS
jgi:ATP-dependent Lon protease